MRLFSGVKPAASIPLLFLGVIGIIFWSTATVEGQSGSDIEVRLCPQTGQSYLTLDSPLEGAVIDDGRVVVKGEAAYLADIEFYVGGTYRTTLQMGESAVGYEQPITLNPGTHTIKAIGYDLCRQIVDTKSVTVSVPEDTSEGQTTTAVPRPKTSKDIESDLPVIYHKVSPDRRTETSSAVKKPQSEDSPPAYSRPATGFHWIDRIISGLDIEATFRSLGNVTRAVAALIGGTLLLAPYAVIAAWTAVLRLFTQRIPAKIKPKQKQFSGVWQKIHTYHKSLLRLFGVLLLLALFIV